MGSIKGIGTISLALLIIGVGIRAFSGDSDDKSDRIKQRLEQLFVWKVSDRLDLKQDTETKFADEYRKLTQEKTDLNKRLDDIAAQIEALRSKNKSADKFVKEYESTARKMANLQLKELEIIKRLFSPSQVADYLVLKRQMTQKVKDVLAQGLVAHNIPHEIKEPQVIEEK